MDEVSTSRSRRFWEQFGHHSRTACQSFANSMQEADADVVMFTARKAACLCDSLRLVQAWTPHAETCTDKALEFDTSWLRDARHLLVVDDVVATGATADQLLYRLEKLGLERLSFLPLATRPEWPASLDALCQRHPDVKLISPAAAAGGGGEIGEEIVRSIAALPRPYNLDWPLLSGWRLSAEELDSLIVQCAWDGHDVSSPFQLQLGIHVITLEPRLEALDELLKGLEAATSSLALIKIRLYAEPIAPNRYLVSVVPLVAFDQLSYDDLDPFRASLGLGKRPDSTSPHGAARTAQYAAALQMGQAFESRMREVMDLGPLYESQWQWSLGFGPKADRAETTDTSSSLPALHPPAHLRREVLTLRQAIDSEAETHYARYKLAAFLWSESNQSARRRARDEVAGSDVQVMLKFLDQPYEHKAFSVSQLIGVLADTGIGSSSAILVSGFLDEAIDNGLTVPSLKESTEGFQRVFRAGETIDFSMREQRLFYVMLEELLRRGPSLKIRKILLEKILVLAIRFGAQRPPLLKPVFIPAGSSVLTIAYSRHGSIATNDARANELPIAAFDTHTLGHELDQLGVITWGHDTTVTRGDASFLQLGPTALDPTSPTSEVPFRRIGALIAELLNSRLVERSDFELFVVLCNGDQVPLALAAELHRMREGLGSLQNAIARAPDARRALRNLLRPTQDWLISLESGLEKLDGIARDVVRHVDATILSRLSGDSLMTWEEVSSAVITPASHPDVARLTAELGLWLIEAGLVVARARKLFGVKSRVSAPVHTPAALRRLAGELGCVDQCESFDLQLSGLTVNDAEPWTRMLTQLLDEAERLWEEVSAGHDRSALHQAPERYEQAFLVVADSPLTPDAHLAISGWRERVPPHQLGAVHPLPPHLVGEHVAGFAIRNSSAMDLAEQLIPYFESEHSLAGCRFVVLTRLGVSRRLLRRPFNSYWYGAGFARMCNKLPSRLAQRNQSRIVLAESID